MVGPLGKYLFPQVGLTTFSVGVSWNRQNAQFWGSHIYAICHSYDLFFVFIRLFYSATFTTCILVFDLSFSFCAFHIGDTSIGKALRSRFCFRAER